MISSNFQSLSNGQKKRYRTIFENTLKNNILVFKKLVNDPIIVGILLSDGYITTTKKGKSNSYFDMVQSDKHVDFIIKIKECFEEYGFIMHVKNIDRYDSRTGKIYKSIRLWSNPHPLLTLLRNIWYPNKRKIIPRNIKLSPELLCIWMEGDGFSKEIVHKNKNKSVNIQIGTDAFDISSLEFIKKLLNDYGIKVNISKSNRLMIYTGEYVTKFMDIINPYICESFRYKIKYPILTKYGITYAKTRRKKKENGVNKTNA